jgi:translation initiation factor 2B subunit (eIF-2B alpha/beta/delta family)
MREFRNPNRIDRAVTRISGDRRSGASELARKAVRIFMLAAPASDVSTARYVGAVDRLFDKVRRARPAMAPVGSVVGRLAFEFARVEGRQSTGAAYAALVRSARDLETELDGIGTEVAHQFRERFENLRRLLTISYSSRVVCAIAALRKPHVTVCESRPAFEGRRTARLLQARSGSVTLVTESQIGAALDECDGVVIGCDAIHPDGSIVNKTGSYLLGLAARDRGRPVIVVGDTYKLRLPIEVPYESHPAGQVWRGAPSGIAVRNVVFEVVPARLVDHIALESGVFEAARMRSVWEQVRRTRKPS